MPCWRQTSATGNPASPCPTIARIWASVNLDFLITLPRRCGSLYFRTAYSAGELTPPVTSTLGLAGGVVQAQRAVSALRSSSQTPNARERNSCISSGRQASYPAQALRAGQGQRSSWQRPRVSSGWRFAPACCAAQSVGGRAAHGRPSFLAAAVHAAREGGSSSVANVGESEGACAA